MAEQEGIGVGDPALPVGEVGVANAARLDGDDDLAGIRSGDDDVDQFNGGTLGP